MLVPVNKQTTDPKYRFLQTKKDPNICIADENHFRIVTLERAIIEGLYYATKIGLDIALEALSIALSTKRTTVKKLSISSQKLGYEHVLKKHWQTLQAIQKSA